MQGAVGAGTDCPAGALRPMRELQPLHNLEGMPEGRPTADSGGTGSASTGDSAEHRMKGVTLPTPTGDPSRGSGRNHWAPDRGTDRTQRSHARGTPLGSGVVLIIALLLCLSFLPPLHAQAIPYSRPVE